MAFPMNLGITSNAFATRPALRPPTFPKLPGRIMDARELALLLRVNPRTLRRLAKRGRIPFYRVGTALRFDAFSVCEALGVDQPPQP